MTLRPQALVVLLACVAVHLPASVATSGEVQPESARCEQVSGDEGDLAVVNLTPVNDQGAGFGALLAAVPTDLDVSNVNWTGPSVDPNVAVTPVRAGGWVCFQVRRDAVHIVLDDLGAISDGRYTSASSDGLPVRKTDTRYTAALDDPFPQLLPPGEPIGPDGRHCFSVAGSPGDAAIVNLTPVQAGALGFGLLVSSDVTATPNTSNVNYGPGTVDPNVAIAPIGTDGQVCYVNSHHTTVHLVADHLATIHADAYTPATATGEGRRVADTRPSGIPLGPDDRRCFAVAGSSGDAAVVNLTPVQADGPGFGLLVSSDVTSTPDTSNVNYGPGTVDPNVAIAPIGADGQVCYVNSHHTTVHLVADHLATIHADAYTPASPSAAPDRVLDTRDVLPQFQAGGVGVPAGDLDCPTVDWCVLVRDRDVRDAPFPADEAEMLVTRDGGRVWVPAEFPDDDHVVEAFDCARGDVCLLSRRAIPGTPSAEPPDPLGPTDPAILRSADGGLTWGPVDHPGFSDGLFGSRQADLECVTAELCVALLATQAFSDGAHVLVASRSTDGGATWETTRVPVSPSVRGGYEIECPTTSTCVALSNTPISGVVSTLTGAVSPLWTDDGGRSWHEVTTSTDLPADTISCMSELTCLASWEDPYESETPVLRRTLDGGRSWTTLRHPSLGQSGVACRPSWCIAPSTDYGPSFLGTFGGRLAITTDIGSTWVDVAEYERMTSEPTVFGHELQCPADQTCLSLAVPSYGRDSSPIVRFDPLSF